MPNKDLALSKELAPLQKAVSVVEQRALAVDIRDSEDLKETADIRSILKSKAKELKEKKERITKPLNEALKNVRELYAPVEAALKNANEIIDNKLLAYQAKVNAVAQKKAEDIAAKVESGKMSEKRALAMTEKLETVETTVRGEHGSIQFRTVKELVIHDITKIPREFLVPDEVKIKAALKGGQEVPGCSMVEKQQVANGR